MGFMRTLIVNNFNEITAKKTNKISKKILLNRKLSAKPNLK